MSTKIITLPERFYTGEPTVQLVATSGRNDHILRQRTSLHMSKTASKSPAMDYLRSVEPEPGKTIVLVVGLGDHETYGPNRNGDGFPSEPVPGKIGPDDVLTKHYQSYDNAHVFEHHVNHDPAKAIGRVKKAFWNPYMRRVEVLEDFDNAKAPHLLEKIASGEYPAKSMGCKIPYDVCTECGNRAETRKDYCDHLKYEMGRIYPNGKQAAALNPRPKFFDSSWVLRPADRGGFMLKKVARDSVYEIRMPSYELGELVSNLQHKAAALGKAADIEKVVSGDVQGSSTGTDKGTLTLVKKYNDSAAGDEAEKMPDASRAMKIIIEYSPEEAVGTTDAVGMPMGLRDLMRYVMGRIGADASPEEEDCACKHASAILELYAAYPRFYDDVIKSAGLEHPRVNPELAERLQKHAAALQTAASKEAFIYGDRPVSDMPIHESRFHVMPPAFAQVRPNTDTLSYTSPEGRVYRTNLGLARRTTQALEDDSRKRQALRGAGMLGIGALGGAAGLSMLNNGRTPIHKALGAAGTLAGAALGAKGVHEAVRSPRLSDLRSPMVMTNEGEIIPAMTEFKEAAWRPEMLHPVLRKRDGACAAIAPARKLAFMRAAAKAEVHDDLSPVLGPTLDLTKIALLLEESIRSCL